MRLKYLNFVEHENLPAEWRFDRLLLERRNLIVGINASGKSRMLKSIDLLASLLSKRLNTSGFMDSIGWKAEFASDGGEQFVYELVVSSSHVISERVTKNGNVLLDRVQGGTGTIMMSRDGSDEKFAFKIPASELAAVNKMDLIQTPFLKPLIDWGNSVFYYCFGKDLGQLSVGMKGPPETPIEAFEHDQRAVVPRFAHGKKTFGDPYIQAIKADMARLGYTIESADLQPPVTFIDPPPGLLSLSVKEGDLLAPTDQMTMSQGMFRAFTILIHANFLAMGGNCNCLIIDDIGEGLDFGRSCKLIDILSEKATAGNFQLILASNDRFVMNHVPLRDFTILRRKGGRAEISNYENSKMHFDEFKLTGLNNFDFFAMDFLSEEIPVSGAEHPK